VLELSTNDKYYTSLDGSVDGGHYICAILTEKFFHNTVIKVKNTKLSEIIKTFVLENRGQRYVMHWLLRYEHLIPEWKKETEKLQKKISVLEEENRQLKENFKTNVVDIIKEYIYNFLPSFLK